MARLTKSVNNAILLFDRNRVIRLKPPKVPEARLIGYARVSTEDQNLELQTNALTRAGVLPDNMHTDKAAGVSRRRPGLRLALMDCRAGDTLVIWKLDRLTRSPPELYALVEKLKDKGIGLRSLTEMLDTTTAIGRLVMGITTAVAGFERDLIAERTAAGLKVIREKREEKGEKWEWGRKVIMTEAKIERVGKYLNSGKSGPWVAKKMEVSTASIYGFWRNTKKKRKDGTFIWVRRPTE